MLGDLAKSATDSVTEVSEQGLGSRLLNSFVGVIVGIALFLGSFVILWWNEGNVVAEKEALTEMSKALVKINPAKINKSQNNKLVHASGTLKSPELLGDQGYLKPGKYLALERHVEMYQWIEKSESKTHKTAGGKTRTETTYSYHKGWAEGRNDSNNFKNPAGHTNPPLPVQGKDMRVKKAQFGAFEGNSILERLSPEKMVPVTESNFAANKKTHSLAGGMIYMRKTPGSKADTVGDVRISYRAVEHGPYSVIARQSGKTFSTYLTQNGREKFIVDAGKRLPDVMIADEKAAAGTFAMFMRIVGFLAMWIGLNLLTGPIVTLLDVIPFLGSAGRLVLSIVYFVAAAVLSAVTIGIAMIAHHPVALVVFLVATAAGGYFLWKRKQNRSDQPPQSGSGSDTHQTTSSRHGQVRAA